MKKATKNGKAKTNGRSKTAQEDIVTLILEDHKPLKKLIEVLKDSEQSLSKRRKAFDQFAPLLISHAKPEEESLYVYMKQDKELREGGLEGDVEHGLADQLIEEAKGTKDEDLWSARVKVLAELVEHHIEEEEEELLPDFRKNSEPDERVALGQTYLQLKADFEAGNEIGTSPGARNAWAENHLHQHQ